MLLEINDLTVRYDRLAAVRDLSLNVKEGEVVSIVGPNGAGKTTTLMTVSGVLRPAKGAIKFQGSRIDGRPVETIARLGIAHVREGRHTFTRMTVEENLEVGLCVRKDKQQGQREKQEIFDRFPRLAERRRQHAGMLSGGEQQMLVVARAMLSRPRFMMVDEPSLGLAPLIVHQVYEMLLNLNRQHGMTLLIVEQKLERALASANRIYVMRSGELQAAGMTTILQEVDNIRDAYFGFAIKTTEPVQ